MQPRYHRARRTAAVQARFARAPSWRKAAPAPREVIDHADDFLMAQEMLTVGQQFLSTLRESI